MAALRTVVICGAVALAGCTRLGGTEFQLDSEHVNEAWGRAQATWRSAAALAVEGEEMQVEYDPARIFFEYPTFSAATCRWREPRRKASCCYRVTYGIPRRGREPQWIEESNYLYLSEEGWSFSTTVTAAELAAHNQQQAELSSLPCARISNSRLR